jgi:hypothetical protein
MGSWTPPEHAHVVLRAKRRVRLGTETLDIVEEHNTVQRTDGAVALAKFGQTPGLGRIRTIQDALKSPTPTNLYLLFKEAGSFAAFSARMAEVSLQNPPTRYPGYYSRAGGHPAIWFVLSSPLEPVEISNLRLWSNGRPLEDVVSESRTVMMLVCTEPPILRE